MDSDFRDLMEMLPRPSEREAIESDMATITERLNRHNGCPSWSISDRLDRKTLRTLENRLAKISEKV